MQILFKDEEREKHIKFTEKIYSMKNLDGYKCFFEKFPKEKWVRVRDEKGSLEEIVEQMKKSEIVVSKLFFGEDLFIPGRYVVNPFNKEGEDRMMEIQFDLTGKNISRIYKLYYKIFNRYFPNDNINIKNQNS
jgi:hypothetical protein